MKDKIKSELEESIEAKKQTIEQCAVDIEKSAQIIVNSIKSGGKLIVFGNGGSAADAQHFAVELICRFKKERKSIPAIALSTNTSNLTAIANDYSFDDVFSRQVEGLCKKEDVVMGISTSGNSPNVLKGVEMAKAIGAKTICLSGSGGKLKDICDFTICVPSSNTPRIQEVHIAIIHILSGLIEELC